MRHLVLFTLFCFFFTAAVSPALADDQVFGSAGPLRLQGDSRSALELGGGVFNYDNGEAGSSAAVKLEYRHGRKLGFVGPALGVVVNNESGVFGYGALYGEVALWRFALTPLFGVGAYHKGAGKDLGGTLEFRSSLGLSFALSDRGRVGVSAAHVSNADLHGKNPGENDFFLSGAFLF